MSYPKKKLNGDQARAMGAAMSKNLEKGKAPPKTWQGHSTQYYDFLASAPFTLTKSGTRIPLAPEDDEGDDLIKLYLKNICRAHRNYPPHAIETLLLLQVWFWNEDISVFQHRFMRLYNEVKFELLHEVVNDVREDQDVLREDQDVLRGDQDQLRREFDDFKASLKKPPSTKTSNSEAELASPANMEAAFDAAATPPAKQPGPTLIPQSVGAAVGVGVVTMAGVDPPGTPPVDVGVGGGDPLGTPPNYIFCGTKETDTNNSSADSNTGIGLVTFALNVIAWVFAVLFWLFCFALLVYALDVMGFIYFKTT